MKFTCEKYLLQSACAIASRATASKSPIPALEGLLIQADTDVRVTGYDLKEGIYTNIGADIEQTGSVVVGARLFGEMIRRLPDGIVSISADDNENINVKCGKSEFNFMGISAEDYPEMPSVDGLNHVELPQKLLKNMINQTIFAVSDSDVRPIYTGTLFEIEDGELTLVSVDGYRLAKRCEIQLAYAIGVAEPVSIMVETFGTGKVDDRTIEELVRKHFDLRPAGIIKMLDLRRPIYAQTAAYGHFGRTDIDLPWEHTDKANDLRKQAGLD